MNVKTQQISFIKINHKDQVEIIVSETVLIAPEKDGEASREVLNEYPVKCGYKPNKSFKDAFLSLRQYGLELGEFSSEDKTQYSVLSLEITGVMELQNSRAQITLSKWVKRTGKNIKIQPGEVMMYGDEYKNADKMTKAIEKVMDEAWKYIRGENAEGIQLSMLFEETEEA